VQAQTGALADKADVLDKLVKAAKAEGTVTIYYTSDKPTFDPGLQAFEKKYGIKVVGYYANAAPLSTRFAAELASGRMVTDIYYASSTEILTAYPDSFVKLSAENLPAFHRLSDRARFPGDIGVARATFSFAYMYNTKKVAAKDAPRTWMELTDPKWKGETTMSDPRVSATYLAMYSMLSDNKPGILSRIADNNPRLVEGAGPNAQQLSAGSGSLGFVNYPSHATPFMEKGAPLQWRIIKEPQIARSAWFGVTKGPHPNAGLLLADYLLSDEALQTYCKLAPGTQTLIDPDGKRTGCDPIAPGALFLPDTPLPKEKGDAVIKELRLP
jgi:iron(III) transport system substrate-binding protein